MERTTDLDHLLSTVVRGCRTGMPLLLIGHAATGAAGGAAALLDLLDAQVADAGPQTVRDALSWGAACDAAAGDLDAAGIGGAAALYREMRDDADRDATLSVLDTFDAFDDRCFAGFDDGDVPSAAADIARRAAVGEDRPVSGLAGDDALLIAAGLALWAAGSI